MARKTTTARKSNKTGTARSRNIPDTPAQAQIPTAPRDEKTRLMNTIVLKASSGGSSSRSMPKDPFVGMYESGDAIMPPYDMYDLCLYAENSSILLPCIESYETNIDGCGWTLECTLPRDLQQKYKKEIEAEHNAAMRFINYCNPKCSFSKLRRMLRRDKELTGNGFWEIIRAPSGKIVGIEHIPAHEMRLCPEVDEFVRITQNMVTEDHEIEQITWSVRFRKFVQKRNGEDRYFKEFGDPRVMKWKGGAHAEDGENIDYKDQASEIWHFPVYSPTTPYGVPRWVAQLYAMNGELAAEKFNSYFLQNHALPPLLLLISGGRATSDTVDRLEKFLKAHMKDPANANRIILMEAEEDKDFGLPEDRGAPVKIEVVPLSQYVKEDAMFREYRKDCRRAVRIAMRLSPTQIGETEDVNRSSSDESDRIIQEQVFAPHRREFDWQFNRLILVNELNIKFWQLRSQGPPLMNLKDQTEAIRNLNLSGAVTPADLRDVASEVVGRKLEPYPEDDMFKTPMPYFIQRMRQKDGETVNAAKADDNNTHEFSPAEISAVKEITEILKSFDPDAQISVKESE